MKLAYIANPNSPHTRRWITWMVRRGHSVLVIADVPLADPWPEVPVIDLPSKINLSVIRYFFWEFWIRRVIQSWTPDILHAHRVSSAGWLGAFSGFHPFVVTPWGSDLYTHPDRSPVARLLAGRVMRAADLVTADSADLCHKAVEFGARRDITYVIQWGVDVSDFKPDEDSVHLRRALEIHAGPVIFSPRGLNPVYNIDTIVRSIPLVKEVFPDVVYILRQYNVDPNYQAQIEALILQLDLRQAVRWIGRIEPYQRLAGYYSLASTVISVPSSDSTAVSLLEAMACGVPIIASDLPSTREWIVNEENGILIPVRDPEKLADATIRLLQNSQQCLNFSIKNKQMVYEKANHQIEMEKVEGLYLGLLPEANEG